MTLLSTMSDQELANAIVTWSGRIAAGEAELLRLIGEFDEREAWGGVGLLSCAHWLSWRTALSPTAAREKVRVARALRDLPLVQEAFGAGRLSYSQVRAITRVATPCEQERWIEAARSATGGQLERVVRGVRRARKVDEDAADPERAAWRMRATKSYDDDGNVVYRLVLPAEASAIVDAGLEAIRADLDARASAEASCAQDEALGEPGPDASAEASCAQDEASGEPGPDASAEASCAQDEASGEPGPDASAEASCAQDEASGEPAPDASAEASPRQPATLADALVEMARRSLAAQPAASARRVRASLTPQVDPLSGWGRLRDGELLPPRSLTAALKALPGRGGTIRLKRLTSADLRVHDLGRRSRHPSLALRELIGTLDGERCRFPGCTRHRGLHAHHVVYWSAGGATDLDNMVLLCGRHHTLVHQLGFSLVLHPDRKLTVTTAEGVPVLHHPGVPWRPAVELDPERRIDAGTLPPDHVVARVDIGYAVMVLAQQSA
jgi:hypothetical protein